MATKTLNTRLQLKYDSFQNWTTNNPVLMAGEVAIATVPTNTGDVKQTPAVLMKVGDGTSHYNDLKFVSGLAANVSSWALAATKPTYAATEITGLTDFVNGTVQDTNTTYQIVKVNDYEYKLQSKELGSETWTDVVNSTIVIPKYDDTQVKADIDALEALVGTTAVATQIANAIAALKLDETYDAKGSAATALTNAKAYTDALANGAVKTNTNAIAAIKDGTTIDSFADVEADLAAKATAIGKAQSAADKAQGDVNALAAKVGTVPQDKTVVGMIAEAQAAATYDDTKVKADIAANKSAIDAVKADYLKAADKTELQGNIDTVSGKVTTLVGTDSGKSVRTIANEELAKQLIPEGAKESLDTLQEIAAWIQQHPDNVSAMNTAISKAQSAADKAQGDVDAVEGRMDTAEGEIDALQAASHTHANKTVLDGITAQKVSNWDAAKTGMDSLTAKVGNVTEGKTVVQMISEAQAAATYDDTAVRGLISGNTTEIGKVAGRVSTLETNAVMDGDTVILNCGTSVIA